MALNHALSVPELVHSIIACLDVSIAYNRPHQVLRDIYACVRVNRLWAEEGTNVLWANRPSFRTFGAMSPSRRCYYALKVKRLWIQTFPDRYFGREESLCIEFLPLNMPRLRSLEIQGKDWNETLLNGLFHPTLLQLSLDFPNPLAFAYVADRCPHLVDLTLVPLSNTLDDGTRKLINSLSSLSILHLKFKDQKEVDFIADFAYMTKNSDFAVNTLHTLHVQGHFIQIHISLGLTPTSLRALYLYRSHEDTFNGDTDTDLIRLVQIFPKLEEFDLYSYNLSGNVEAHVVEARDITDFALAHPQLKKLSLNWPKIWAGISMSDDDIDSFAALLTNLTHLTLHLCEQNHPRTFSVFLSALGKCCRSLQSLTINVEEDFASLSDLNKLCLFPELEFALFTVDYFYDGYPIKQRARIRKRVMVKRIIAQHFPNLTTVFTISPLDDGQNGYWSLLGADSRKYNPPWSENVIDCLLCRYPYAEGVWVNRSGLLVSPGHLVQ
ncbi:hypothetical protein GQ44DRAFT_775071 [Phaeosphaeriaceae sp. PMI808]|nr:hypothetical protein GQ44DRAFT_775071 [Phaeosphaeriaceae sp. PMI808]